LFKKAWGISRHNAKHHGGGVRLHFAQALRQSWAEAKATAQRIAEERERVLAAIAEMRFRQSEIGRARHERHMTNFRARCDADLAAALEMSRRLTRPTIRRVA
jgi:hypothetical protein